MNPSTLVERWQLIQAINADPELSAGAVKVAVALMGFINSKTGDCYPTLEKIVACCRVSKRTAVRATQALESRGWVCIERDAGGDRDSNRYHFTFDRVRDAGEDAAADQTHGAKITPCSPEHGAKSDQSMVPNFSVHGAKSKPELEEENLIKGTQESLFGEGQLLNAPPFDFDIWFEQWWLADARSASHPCAGDRSSW